MSPPGAPKITFSTEMDVHLLEVVQPTMTYISAVLPCRLGGQRLDSLPIELSRATVVLGVGVIGGTAVLMEKGRLQRKTHELMAMRH